MPLISRWTPQVISIPCKKGEPVKQSIFCHHNTHIDDILIEMHTLQRSGNRDIQQMIDRYLFICYNSVFCNLKLPKTSVPHYNNLPDIFTYTVGILDSNMDSDSSLQQVLLLLRQCIPLRRRTKRAQREVQWTTDNMFSMQTLIRCMQGMLLALYPTSLNNIAFHARIGVIVFLRTLLVQPFHILQKALQRIGYILKLAVMEHLCCTIIDYYPSVCHTLNRSGQKIEHFCNSVSTICDIFRGELNSLFCAQIQKNQALEAGYQSRIFMSIIPQLNKLAHSYFERCTRAYRGIIVGHTVHFKHIEVAKRLLNQSIISQLPLLWSSMHFSSNQNVFEKVHLTTLSQDMVNFAWHMSRVLNVNSLPPCVMQNQLRALSTRYGGDMSCIKRCRMIHICVVCVIRRGSIQGMRLRHDCQTGSLSCIHCDSNTILSIDALGRIICIGHDRVILSSCCGTFIHYGGSGFDFSTSCNIHCSHSRQLFKKKEKQLSSKLYQSLNLFDDSVQDRRRKCKNVKFKFQYDKNNTSAHLVKDKQCKKQLNSFSHWRSYLQDRLNEVKSQPQCEMCGQRSIHQTLSLLHVGKRSIVQMCLCSKHLIPQHICKSILHHDHLYEYFAMNSTHKARTTNELCKDSMHSNHIQPFFDPNLENALIERKGRRGRKPKYLARYLLSKKMHQEMLPSNFNTQD